MSGFSGFLAKSKPSGTRIKKDYDASFQASLTLDIALSFRVISIKD